MGAVEYFKAAYDLARKAQNVELQGQLMEAREEFNALKEEAIALRERVAELERERELRQATTYKEPSYFVTKRDGTEDGPFCQKCYDADQKLIRQHESTDAMGTTRHCQQCDAVVQVGPVSDTDPYSGWRG